MTRKELSYNVIPSTGQKYHAHGEKTRLLIAGGTHGDEGEVVPLVEATIINFYSRLPDFLYVPEISPSAVKLGTRRNADGLDVNRSFLTPPPTQEVAELMKLWINYSFDTFLTFHTDPTQTCFFLYDGIKDGDKRLDKTSAFSLLQKDIRAIGVDLYNGTDDPEDPNLGYEVKDGYAYWPMINNDHSTDYWLIVETGRTQRVINPEIPGLVTLDKKQKIIEAIFRRLVLDIKE